MVFLVRTPCAVIAIFKKLMRESNDNSFSPGCWDVSAVEDTFYQFQLFLHCQFGQRAFWETKQNREINFFFLIGKHRFSLLDFKLAELFLLSNFRDKAWKNSTHNIVALESSTQWKLVVTLKSLKKNWVAKKGHCCFVSLHLLNYCLQVYCL